MVSACAAGSLLSGESDEYGTLPAGTASKAVPAGKVPYSSDSPLNNDPAAHAETKG